MHDSCKRFIYARDNGLLRTKMTKKEREDAIKFGKESILDYLFDSSKFKLRSICTTDNDGFTHEIEVKLTKKGNIILKNYRSIHAKFGNYFARYMKDIANTAGTHCELILATDSSLYNEGVEYRVKCEKEHLIHALTTFCGIFDYEVDDAPLSYDTN